MEISRDFDSLRGFLVEERIPYWWNWWTRIRILSLNGTRFREARRIRFLRCVHASSRIEKYWEIVVSYRYFFEFIVLVSTLVLFWPGFYLLFISFFPIHEQQKSILIHKNSLQSISYEGIEGKYRLDFVIYISNPKEIFICTRIAECVFIIRPADR